MLECKLYNGGYKHTVLRRCMIGIFSPSGIEIDLEGLHWHAWTLHMREHNPLVMADKRCVCLAPIGAPLLWLAIPS